jgi:hypothetical protein
MNYIVTCQTENCNSNGIAIEVINPEPTVICGACGQEITDKQPVNLDTETTQE